MSRKPKHCPLRSGRCHSIKLNKEHPYKYTGPQLKRMYWSHGKYSVQSIWVFMCLCIPNRLSISILPYYFTSPTSPCPLLTRQSIHPLRSLGLVCHPLARRPPLWHRPLSISTRIPRQGPRIVPLTTSFNIRSLLRWHGIDIYPRSRPWHLHTFRRENSRAGACIASDVITACGSDVTSVWFCHISSLRSRAHETTCELSWCEEVGSHSS